MKQKQVLHIYSNIRKRVKELNYPCMCNGCQRTAINSHLLQKHGILSQVFENGHMYEPRVANIFNDSFLEFPSEFKRVGVDLALSVHTFCKEHDDNLFSEIEKDNIDFENYRHVLLLTYRAVCAEARRKEYEVEILRRFLSSNIVSNSISPYEREFYSDTSEGYKMGYRDLVSHAHFLESELACSNHQIVFYHKSFPISGVYCSATFSLDEISDVKPDSPLGLYFVHIIPTSERTHVILGCDREHETTWAKLYFSELLSKKDSEIEEYVTSLLIRNNGWGISPSVYRQLDKSKIDEFFSYYNMDRTAVMPERYENFNLFDNSLLNEYNEIHSAVRHDA